MTMRMMLYRQTPIASLSLPPPFRKKSMSPTLETEAYGGEPAWV